MSMDENIKEEIVEDDDVSNETTSVEIDLQSEESNDSDQTRTNVREEVKAEPKEDELASYSEGVKKRINKLTAKQKLASEEAEAAKIGRAHV